MNTNDQYQDTPLTMASIQAFRRMLDVMEEFIKNTETERLDDIRESAQGE